MTREPLDLGTRPAEPLAPWAEPASPAADGVTDLATLSGRLLAQARADARGKATLAVLAGNRQRALLVALTAGHGLAEHASPPAAALLAWSGRFRLNAPDRHWEVGPGQLVPIPPERHSVDCLEDGTFLLVVTPPNA